MAVDGGYVKYAIKVINPNKGGVETRDWCQAQTKFTNISAMRSRLAVDFHECIGENEFDFGYIQPGHGIKGRQQSLTKNEDLMTMYELHKRRKQIVLWLKLSRIQQVKLSCTESVEDRQSLSSLHTPKRPRVDDSKMSGGGGKPRSNHEIHVQKMSQVEEIIDKLEGIHGTDLYTPEQLRAWAHMLQMRKHSSYDSPPKKPFFKSASTCKSDQASTVTCGSSSPGKKFKYRSECIDQLDKWHSLMERGAISHEQFQEMQQTILSDMKEL